jgi:hypothetical protein
LQYQAYLRINFRRQAYAGVSLHSLCVEAPAPRSPRRKEAVGREAAEDPRWDEGNGVEEHAGRELTEAERAREVWERRRRSVLTCDRGLRSALASGDERLVRRWSRSLRGAEVRLAWAEADLARAEKRSERSA